MCEASKEIKFCTCGDGVDLESADWVLYRRGEVVSLGETIAPYGEALAGDSPRLEQALAAAMNNPANWDNKPDFQPGDRVYVRLNPGILNALGCTDDEHPLGIHFDFGGSPSGWAVAEEPGLDMEQVWAGKIEVE